jgi:hypothetical protein
MKDNSSGRAAHANAASLAFTSVTEPSSEPAPTASEQQWHIWVELCASVRSISESATTARKGKKDTDTPALDEAHLGSAVHATTVAGML